jgi:O-antigen/teichoic acid export membrane protein
VSFTELGIRQSTIFFSGKKIFNLNTLFSVNFYFWVFSSAICVVLFLFLAFFKDLGFSIDLLLLSALIIPLSIANTYLNGLLYSANKIKKTATYTFLNGLLKLLLLVLLIKVLDFRIYGAIISIVGSFFIVLILKMFFLIKNRIIEFRLSFNFKVIKRVFSKGVLYSFSLFLLSNQKTIPVLLLAGKVSEADIGFYSVALVFTSLLSKLNNSLSPLIFVTSSNTKDDKRSSENIQKLMRVIVVFLVLICVVLSLGIDEVVKLVYGESFLYASKIAIVLFIGLVFYNILLILNMDIAGKGDTKTMLTCLVPVSFVNVLLNYIFISKYGVIGAASATTISMILASAFFLFLYSKKIKTNITDILMPKKTDWDFIKKIIDK